MYSEGRRSESVTARLSNLKFHLMDQLRVVVWQSDRTGDWGTLYDDALPVQLFVEWVSEWV